MTHRGPFQALPFCDSVKNNKFSAIIWDFGTTWKITRILETVGFLSIRKYLQPPLQDRSTSTDSSALKTSQDRAQWATAKWEPWWHPRHKRLGLGCLGEGAKRLPPGASVRRQGCSRRFRAPQEPGPPSYADARGGSHARMHGEIVHETASGERGLSSFQPFLQKISDSFPASYCRRAGTGLAEPHPGSRLCS